MKIPNITNLLTNQQLQSYSTLKLFFPICNTETTQILIFPIFSMSFDVIKLIKALLNARVGLHHRVIILLERACLHNRIGRN